MMTLSLRVKRRSGIALCVLVFLVSTVPGIASVQAESKLGDRYVQVSTSVTGVTARHTVGFTVNDDTEPLGSVRIEYCSNDPLPHQPCTLPSGLDVSSAQLISQTGHTGFSILSASANELVLSRSPSVPVAGPAAYEFDQITNPSAAGSYYIRLYTYSSADGTGTVVEEGGAAIAINRALDITTEVPPYLKFCAGVTVSSFDCATATSFLLDMGEFTTTKTATAASQMVIATNAPSGYTVTLTGTTLTSGNNVINAATTPSLSAAGSSQFGMNLRVNTNPPVGAEPTGIGTGTVTADYNLPNRFKFLNGDTLVTSSTTSDNHKFTVSYIANVSGGQPAGYYSTTMSFIALANF